MSSLSAIKESTFPVQLRATRDHSLPEPPTITHTFQARATLTAAEEASATAHQVISAHLTALSQSEVCYTTVDCGAPARSNAAWRARTARSTWSSGTTQEILMGDVEII